MTYRIKPFRKSSRADIARIFLAAESLVEEWVGRDTLGCDIHHTICDRLCDEFDVWEVVRTEPSEVYIPTWLMYMVAGVMRDKGVRS